MDRARVIEGLRQLADFLEAHPEAPFPRSNRLYAHAIDMKVLGKVARIKGGWSKREVDSTIFLEREFQGAIQYIVSADRAKSPSCRAVVKGARTIPASPERVVEEVEWICDDPLLRVGEGEE